MMTEEELQQKFTSILELAEFALLARRQRIVRENPGLGADEIDKLFENSLTALPSHSQSPWFRPRNST